jgi:site-specific DNA-methyltransferase (adenine-specific)
MKKQRSIRQETFGDEHSTAILYRGDSRDVLEGLGPFDACVTDPPYGVGLGKIKSHIGKNEGYEGFEDNEEYVREVVIPIINKAVSISKCAILTPGTRCMWYYPKPAHIGCIFFPAGGGRNPWGFTCYQSLLYYGKDPYAAQGFGSLPDGYSSTEISEKNGHPCPKPLGMMQWMVRRVTTGPKQSVLDPFMGSGTTGVACARMGRDFVGIEMESKYFDIACRQIDRVYKRKDFFREKGGFPRAKKSSKTASLLET